MLERSGWINKEHGKYSITYCVHAELNRKPRIPIKHSSINCYCTESRYHFGENTTLPAPLSGRRGVSNALFALLTSLIKLLTSDLPGTTRYFNLEILSTDIFLL
jgi:hypothetical protein